MAQKTLAVLGGLLLTAVATVLFLPSSSGDESMGEWKPGEEVEVAVQDAGDPEAAQVENPGAWAAKAARFACMNYANRQLARDRRNRADEEIWEVQVEADPNIYPYRVVAGADAIEYALGCLSDRERELVHLIDAGYSHAEVAQMMGYAGARSVTTTLNRIRTKIIDHVGGRDELEDLMGAVVCAMESAPLVPEQEPVSP